jgi:SAM-dependent methyltransferase
MRLDSNLLSEKLRSAIPSSLRRGFKAFLRQHKLLPPVRFGDLRRTSPISTQFGFDRGTPIDRYYIESFLQRHANDVAGCVLEVGDDAYTKRFGGARVTKSDVLHVDASNPRATLIGDISQCGVLPVCSFDCIILTQTLHLIFDVPAALAAIRSALKPSGVLLLTVPGISQIDRGQWGLSWYWAFTPLSIGRLFERQFGSANVNVESYGNVFAATAFLYGLAVQDVGLTELDVRDESYPVTIAARAVKPFDAC